MDYEDLERERRIEELRRQYKEKLAGKAPAPEKKPADEYDPDAPLVSDETKKAVADVVAKTREATRAQMADLMEKGQKIRERLKEESARVLTPATDTSHADASTPLPRVQVDLPKPRFFTSGMLALTAGILWVGVGAGYVWTRDPSPSVPVIAQAQVEVPVDQPADIEEAVPVEVASQVREPVAPAPAQPEPAPAVVEPVVPVTPAAKPALVQAPPVDDQWTEEANAELDEWERVLRSE